MNEKLLKIKQWIEVVRDIGLIIGVPALIVIGAGLYERQIDALKAENKLLQKTQYDRAWVQIESQKKLFENEREMLLSRIDEEVDADLSKGEEIVRIINELDEVNKLFVRSELIVPGPSDPVYTYSLDSPLE